MNVSSVKNLNGETFSAVQDTTLTDVVQSNSSTWSDVTAYQSNSANYITAHQSLDGYATTAWVNEKGYITGVEIPESATWNEVSTTVQTNSAQWAEGGCGSSDTFYIYPGKTTDKEISENSGKDLKLYNSANNVFLDFAGKSTLSKYTMFSFKEITGTQANQNTVQHLRLRVYPNATSACKVYDTNTVNLLDTNSTVNYANTAYADGNGNSLVNTYDTVTALSSFVESNSANWGGGSSPTGGDSVLFHLYYSDDNYGNTTKNSYISGATELYFEASMNTQEGSPNDVIINRDGSLFGIANWSQVSSDGYNNYFTASFYNADGSEIELHNSGNDYLCYVYANGLKTYAFGQRSYYCKTNDTIKINAQGSNVTGYIIGRHQGMETTLTSFTGSLSNFTANGYDLYNAEIFSEDTTQPFSYDVSAALVSGEAPVVTEVSHDNTLSGNGTVESPLGVILSATNDANVNNIVVTASLPSTPDANTLYLIPET